MLSSLIDFKKDVLMKTFYLLFIFIFFTNSLFADITKAEAIANYIYNFAKYTEFPNEFNYFSIHLISENEKLKRVIKQILTNQKLHNKKIKISSSKDIYIPKDVNLIFIEKDKRDLHRKIYNKIEGSPILLVSDGYGNRRLVMINLIKTGDDKLKFEINKANILNQGLNINPKIILLGGSEIDVAKLYKSVNSSLLQKEDELDNLKIKIKKFIIEIENKEKLLKDTREKISKYKKEILSLGNEASKLKENLKVNKEELNTNKKELENERLKLFDTQKELKSIQGEYNKALGELENLKVKVKKNVDLLSEMYEKQNKLNIDIDSKKLKLKAVEEKLKEKNILLQKKDTTIYKQQKYMLIITISATIFLLLLAVIAILLRREFNTNKKLKETQALLVTQAKMAQMGEMLTMIAHHWRQPLNRIGVIVQNMQDDYIYDELDKDSMTKRVDDIMNVLENISSTINRFSKRVNKNEKKQKFNPKLEIEKVLKLFEPEFEANDIKVNLQIGDDYRLYGNIIQFEEIFINILKNAEEAITSNNIPKNRVIEIIFNLENDLLEIKVFNMGEKLTENLKTKIFEPFFTTKGITKKSGLGLYSSKLIIEEEFNGFISVENRENGVEFNIKLPIKKEN